MLSEDEGEGGAGVDRAGPDGGRDGAKGGVTLSTPSSILEVSAVSVSY